MSIDNAMDIIAKSLDSIRIAERMLTVKVDENGRRLTRQQIKQNLDLLEELIHRQKSRIADLEGALYRQTDSTNSYKSLITYLYTQIDQKDAEINSVRHELGAARSQNSVLTATVSNLEETNDLLSQQIGTQQYTIQEQSQILAKQDALLNVGYVRIGTSKELSADGLISKKFLSSSKANYENIDKSAFNQVDIRQFVEVQLQSKKPKILTNHPQSSYTLKKEGDVTILSILKPEDFWSISEYLIVLL